jgi:E3 ubiquitin-protein ligase FANCL
MAAECAVSGSDSAAAAAAAVLARTCPGAAFPLLLPADGALRAWQGFLAVRDGSGGAREFALRLEGLPGLSAEAGLGDAPLAGATLLPGAPLAELREAIASALAAAPPAAPPPPAFAAALAAQLGGLPPGALADVSADLTRLTLRFADACAREHRLSVTLPPGFPARAPALQADLPLPVALAWRPGASGLRDCLAAGAAAARRHAPLWAALDALDAAAWVLEPEAPAPRAACHRRLSLGGAAAVWLSLDAAAFAAAADGGAAALAALPPPALRVYGPERGAAPRREALAAALAAWAPPSRDALASGAWLPAWLTAALGERLPARPGASGASDNPEAAPPECGICYAFACPVSGQPPALGCDNPRCGRPFHAPCLAEWLRADGGAAGGGGRAAFGTLFGACPYCSAPIAVAPEQQQ